MHIQIHARRFGDTPKARNERFFNDQAAIVELSKDDEIEIVIKGGFVHTTINGKSQMPVQLGEWEYTAFCICYGDAPIVI